MELSLEQLERYKRNFESEEKYKLFQDVLNTTHIDNVVTSKSKAVLMPHKFNHKISKKHSIIATDQKNSGRCWIFASLNVFRHAAIKHHNFPSNFELSQAYIYKCDRMEKCNAALELMYDLSLQNKKTDSIEYAYLFPTVLSDGGTWSMFAKLVNKYGVVPIDIFPDNTQTTFTSTMNQIIYKLVMKASTDIEKKLSRAKFEVLKDKVLNECYRVIHICIGSCSSEFSWSVSNTRKTDTYTPLSFYKKIIKPYVNVDNYIELCNCPNYDLNTKLCTAYSFAEINSTRHNSTYYSESFINVHIDIMKKAVFTSIKRLGHGVYFGCDYGLLYVLNKFTLMDMQASNLDKIFDVNLGIISKRDGLQTGTTRAVHAMIFTGCHQENNSITRWQVENSHGDSFQKGMLTMSDSFFKNYVISVVVPKDCIPKHILKIENDPCAKVLPFYSYMATFQN